MQITVLNVVKTQPPGKKYFVLDVAYKDSFGKVASKKIFSFGAQEPAFQALVNAPSGSVFTCDVIKNDQGYNDWVKAVQAPPGSVASAPGSINESKAVSVKSTYETADERAKKQIYIIRQSSISSAVDTLSVGSKSSPSPEDVLKVAQKYYDWVMQDPEQAVAQDVFSLPNDLEVE